LQDYPNKVSKKPNSFDLIINNQLKINFNLQTLIVVIGASLRNIYTRDLSNTYFLEFDHKFQGFANIYYCYQIEARKKFKSFEFINQKPSSTDYPRILNFNKYPMKNTFDTNRINIEDQKNLKDYICLLQSQNIINNMNLEILNQHLEDNYKISENRARNANNRTNIDDIYKTMNKINRNYFDKNTNIIEEIENEFNNILKNNKSTTNLNTTKDNDIDIISNNSSYFSTNQDKLNNY